MSESRDALVEKVAECIADGMSDVTGGLGAEYFRPCAASVLALIEQVGNDGITRMFAKAEAE